jgi:hypothetical protein
MFMKGQTSMTFAESSRYPSASTISEKLKEAGAMVHNRRVGIVEIAKKNC